MPADPVRLSREAPMREPRPELLFRSNADGWVYLLDPDPKSLYPEARWRRIRPSVRSAGGDAYRLTDEETSGEGWSERTMAGESR